MKQPARMRQGHLPPNPLRLTQSADAPVGFYRPAMEFGNDVANACPNAVQPTCLSPTGPNIRNPGWSLLGLFLPESTTIRPATGMLPLGKDIFNRQTGTPYCPACTLSQYLPFRGI